MLPVVSVFFNVAYCAMSDTTLETCEIPIVKKNLYEKREKRLHSHTVIMIY